VATTLILPRLTRCWIAVIIFARLLGTFVLRSGTFALAFMIDVTGSITLVLRCLTMRVALVHDINDLGIGEGQRITMTLRPGISNRELIVLVPRQNGELAIAGESCISVVHDRAEIVFHAEGIRVSLLMEVISVRSLNVFVIDLQRIVPVDSALLVMQSDGVSQLMQSRAVVSASRERERDLMVSMRVPDGGITSTTGKDGDFVVVSGLSVLTAAGWRENHAGFFHPFLHCRIDIIRYRE